MPIKALQCKISCGSWNHLVGPMVSLQLCYGISENPGPNMMQTLDIIQFTDYNGNQRESACALLWIIIFSLVRLID